MASLHNTIDYTKKILLGGGAIIGSIMLIVGLFRFGGFLKNVVDPAPPPTPKMRFGKLPVVTFPPSAKQDVFTFTVDTPSGLLPVFPDRENVYKITRDEEPNLFDLRRAKSKVAQIDFESVETKISETVYQWSDNKDLSRRIVLDAVSLNFIYTTNFMTHPPLLSSTRFIDEEMAKEDATEFLVKLGLVPNDLNRSKTKTQLLSIVDNEIVPSASIATTQLVRVDFFQKDINKLPIYYPNPQQSTINFLVSNYGNQPVVEANFIHQKISGISTDYPIITTAAALKVLQDGNGYIASHFGDNTNIPIRNVFQAYYLGPEKQEYLMPIIVFTDNEGFYAYVSAVKDEWME